jgi:hypothetical protein
MLADPRADHWLASDRQPLRVGLDLLNQRLVREISRRGIQAAVLASEGLSHLSLKRDRRLGTDFNELTYSLRRWERACCRGLSSEPRLRRYAHEARHRVRATDEIGRSRSLFWSAAHRDARNAVRALRFVLPGLIIVYLAIGPQSPLKTEATAKTLLLGVGLALIVAPLFKNLKVPGFELSAHEDQPVPLRRSDLLATGAVVQRLVMLSAYEPVTVPDIGKLDKGPRDSALAPPLPPKAQMASIDAMGKSIAPAGDGIGSAKQSVGQIEGTR